MWGRAKKADVVAASLKETQVAREMITESGLMLTDIEGELMQILSGGARAEVTALRLMINNMERRG